MLKWMWRSWVLAWLCSGLLGAVQAAPQLLVDRSTPVRGVWVATPHHTRFWQSPAEMDRQLRGFQAAGLNTVYVAVWNQGRTMYPSARMAALTGAAMADGFAGRDPLQEVIDAAKPLGLRVVAWMEFGFASHYQGGPGREIVARHPGWAALSRDGTPVIKNGFHWLNALDPEVQAFITSLALELAQRYPGLHGIQGDDRLPALPTAAGHNPGVLAAYRSAHGGREPPADDQDPAWVQWRADRLTDYLRDLRRQIKGVRPQLLLSLSPSPYPWGLNEYLQDWPRWLREGLADELLPQLYRRDLPAYQRLLDETLAWVPSGQRHRVFPGLLLALGPNVVPSPELLAQWIAATRAAGIGGEVYFHSEGVAPRAEVLRQAYGR